MSERRGRKEGEQKATTTTTFQTLSLLLLNHTLLLVPVVFFFANNTRINLIGAGSKVQKEATCVRRLLVLGLL